MKADLSYAILSYVDFSNAHLNKAILSCATLLHTDLDSTDLTGSSLDGVRFERTILEETNFLDTEISISYGIATTFIDTDLSKVKHLETCKHGRDSILDAKTLAKSGQLPVEFLRGIGLADWQIEETKLLQPDLSNEEINNIIYQVYDLRANRSIQISPLYISYSSSDDKFVDALEPKLIEKGIRFWRDKREMASGNIEKQIDRGLRLNDIVLLVLSEHSLKSDWVEMEIESARQKEKEADRDVLCPVTLDKNWEEKCDWPGRLLNQIKKYHILDFSNWQDPVAFESQFGKLLKGLDLFYK